MNPFLDIYNFVFYQPVFTILVFLYSYLHDFGLAVILLTIFVRILLLPFTFQTSKMQAKMNKIQSELKEVEKKYNGEEKVKKIIEIYRKEKINPFFSLFSSLFQLPILIALYQVFLKGVKEISQDPKFLYFFDLSKPNFFLIFLALVFQLLYFQSQTKKEIKKGKNIALGFFQRQLNYFFLFFTFLILLKLPPAICLYLIVNFLFLISQTKIFHA
jgi:YidC/Oxa1 family membrane protein insertase